MNFDFTEEQTMIKDSVARFVRDEYDFDTRRAIVSSEDGISRDFWAKFAELGWLSVPFSEEYGGFGGSVDDLSAVMEEMGKGIVVEPFASTIVVFGSLMSASPNSDLKAKVIPSIIDGSCMGTFACVEEQSRYEMSDVCTSAEVCPEGFRINGKKTVVSNASTANKFIVSARCSGDQFDRDGISLFLVDSSVEGVEIDSFKMMDGQSAATVTFKNVLVNESELVSELGTCFISNIIMDTVACDKCAIFR